jgi:hypothetical protein
MSAQVAFFRSVQTGTDPQLLVRGGYDEPRHDHHDGEHPQCEADCEHLAAVLALGEPDHTSRLRTK